jgi:hypothetical protein
MTGPTPLPTRPWLSEAHLEALLELLEVQPTGHPYVPLLIELAVGLTQEFAASPLTELLGALRARPEPPLTHQDLFDLQLLVEKGVAHNGVIPALDTLRVARALQHWAELSERADAAAGCLAALHELEAVFDLASYQLEQDAYGRLRGLESNVRRALGWHPRQYLDLVPYNEYPA